MEPSVPRFEADETPMAKARNALAEWKRIVGLVERIARERNLDRRVEGSTVREIVHHVVEANVVAAGILTAALGNPGSVFDWSWMMPFGRWMTLMRYDRKPVAPALRLLRALNAYVVAQIEPLPDGLRRTVRLRETPGGRPRRVTVAQVLLQEGDHAREEVAGVLESRRRSTR
jgi:hypothetical protein